MKKIVTILAARLDSTRLRSKTLLPINGKSMIELIMNRLKRSKLSSELILATDKHGYETLKAPAEKCGARIFKGSKDDVLKRYYDAAVEHEADIIVRATGDNPLVCVPSLDEAARFHIESGNSLSFLSGLPWGSGVEVISFDALEKSHLNANEKVFREHITQYIYRNPQIFSVGSKPVEDSRSMEGLRLTVDVHKDYLRSLRIFDYFHQDGDHVDISHVIEKIRKEEFDKDFIECYIA